MKQAMTQLKSIQALRGIAALDRPLVHMEVGPQPVLSALGRACDDDRSIHWMTSLRRGKGEWGGRACTKYDVFENDIKTQEICSAPLDQINGAAEMMDTFQGMASFVKKLSESLPGPLGSSFNEHPGMVAELIGGFPVHSIEYRMGKPNTEVSMESIREEELSVDKFEVPADYALQDPFAAR